MKCQWLLIGKYFIHQNDTRQLVMSYLRVGRLFALVKIDFKLKFNGWQLLKRYNMHQRQLHFYRARVKYKTWYCDMDGKTSIMNSISIPIWKKKLRKKNKSTFNWIENRIATFAISWIQTCVCVCCCMPIVHIFPILCEWIGYVRVFPQVHYMQATCISVIIQLKTICIIYLIQLRCFRLFSMGTIFFADVIYKTIFMWILSLWEQNFEWDITSIHTTQFKT